MNKRKFISILAAFTMVFGVSAATLMIAGCEKKPTDIVTPGDDKNPDDGKPGDDKPDDPDNPDNPDNPDQPDPPVPTICYITFDANGGAFADGSQTKEAVALYNKAVAEIADKPVKSGSLFMGWAAEGSEEIYDFSASVTEEYLTLKAVWESENLEGEGTKESPYLIKKASDLTKLAKAVNAVKGDYLGATYSVEADIDASGITMAPLGSAEAPFSGVFLGNGKTISNLSVRVYETGAQVYAGFFGYVELAHIENISFDNIAVSVEESSVGVGAVYAGAAAGYVHLTNLTNVSATGSIAVTTIDSNSLTAGGLVGYFASGKYENENRIVSFRGGYSNVAVTAKNLSGATLADTVVGGAVGTAFADTGALVLNNIVNAAAVSGTQAAGGVVAIAGNGNITISDCFNGGSVNATGGSEGYAYAGGIVGQYYGDSVVIDCLSLGNVAAAKSTSTYKSYAGGVVGYSSEDDYTYYYTAGGAIVNSYYVRGVTCPDNINANGKRIAAEEVTAAFLAETLRWTDISLDGASAKLALSALPETFTVTFKDGDRVVDTSTVSAGSILGVYDGMESVSGSVFYDWSYAADKADFADYRYYMAVYKDITLYSAFYDVSAIAGAYKGEEEKNGSLLLGDDGAFHWYGANTTSGTYRYDGTHFIAEFQGDEMSGEFNAEGQLVIVRNEGMNDYTFTFSKFTPAVHGQFINENGDFIVFSGEKTVRLEIEGSVKEFTYSADSETQISIKTSGLTVATLTISENGLTVASTRDSALFEKGAVFSPALTGGYSDESFIGKWTGLRPGSIAGEGIIYSNLVSLDFKDNGSLEYTYTYGGTETSYYYIQSTGVLKFLIDGNISNFKVITLDGVDILYGKFNSGVRDYQQAMLLFKEDAELEVYRLDIENATGTYVRPESYVLRHGDKFYVIYRGELIEDAVIEGSFALDEKTSITIDGQKTTYILKDPGIPVYGSGDNYSDSLYVVGEEEGEYTGAKGTFALDGAGSVSGAYGGSYTVDGTRITVYDGDAFFAFDYAAAQQNGNAYALLQGDGMEGYYYNDAERFASGSYRLFVDGFGRAVYEYYGEEYGEYRNNWGSSEGEEYNRYTAVSSVTYRARMNAYYTIYFTKLDENNIYVDIVYEEGGAAERHNTFVLTKFGEAPVSKPAFDQRYVGTWNNGDSTLIIAGESACTLGTQSGAYIVFTAEGYRFVAGGTEYLAVLSGDGSTLTVNGVDYTKGTSAPGGDVESWLSAVVGTWTCSGRTSVIISSDGTVTYGEALAQLKYDQATKVYSFSYGETNCKFTVGENGAMSFSFEFDGSDYGPFTYTKA